MLIFNLCACVNLLYNYYTQLNLDKLDYRIQWVFQYLLFINANLLEHTHIFCLHFIRNISTLL